MIEVPVSTEPLLELMRLFVERQICADGFCDSYVALWTADRDATQAQKLTWTEPHDEKLLHALQNGDIGPEEFAAQWERLWGYADFVPLQETIDAIHSACMCFSPEPTLAWEIDEDQFREEVADSLAPYHIAVGLGPDGSL
jgi:hypothetical protein